MAKFGQKKSVEIDVQEIQRGEIELCVIGKTPLVLNRMSEKARRTILLPDAPRKKTKSLELKHFPVSEFRDSFYRIPDGGETLIGLPSTAFKGAIRSAAVEMPGSSKAQMGRLTFIRGDLVPIYGSVKLHMSVVRQAGMNRTPDIRTRAIMPEWCATMTLEYIKPQLTLTTVTRILAAGGLIMGVGDGRPEKGWGTFGQFEMVDPGDAEFQRIKRTMHRDAQLKMINEPECYDAESRDMLEWFQRELEVRERTPVDTTATDADEEDVDEESEVVTA